ncbi:hypothetical protein SVIOM74S_05247 [Streptomyces violarus]
MPDDAETARARQRTGTGIGLLLVLVLGAALLIALPDDESPDDDTACRARTVRSWQADDGLTAEFARYGDDTTRTDDWTGGDGTHSVRLPDGRVLWLFSDTYLGRVYGPPNPAGESHAWRDTTAPLVRNSAVLMRDGRLETTLPAPLFADPAPNQWRWPVAARASNPAPRLLGAGRPGAAVGAHGARPRGSTACPPRPRWPRSSLPDLRLESVVEVLDQATASFRTRARRVLFGTTLVEEDGWTSSTAETTAQADHPAPASQRTWRGYRRAGSHECRLAGGTGPARPGRGGRPPGRWLGAGSAGGVGSAVAVGRDGGTYVLFTHGRGHDGR